MSVTYTVVPGICQAGKCWYILADGRRMFVTLDRQDAYESARFLQWTEERSEITPEPVPVEPA